MMYFDKLIAKELFSFIVEKLSRTKELDMVWIWNDEQKSQKRFEYELSRNVKNGDEPDKRSEIK